MHTNREIQRVTVAERCDFCGRFLKQVWYQASDEPDSWQDYWSCSQDAKHKAERPRDYGLESHDSESATDRPAA